jgi:superfamily II DNA helicase RecQ
VNKQDIASGRYQLIVASPEYVEQDSRFRRYLWDSANFRKQVTRIVFDEAHCVMDWGDFRPAYNRLCFIRPFLPHATFLALSATLSPLMVTELKRLLGLYDVEVIRRSNDRHNISLVVKQMKHTLHSLHDLAFLIPPGFNDPSHPPRKFMLFMRSKKQCQQAGRFLRARLAPELQDRVIWVHSEMTSGFNERAMVKLRNGDVYGIVCTDVAGMVSL